MKVILISGKKRTGKSTLQNALIYFINNHTPECATAVNFADEIYRIHDYAIKRLRDLGFSPQREKDRKLLQFLGTEWARKTYGEDVWVNVMKKKIIMNTKKGFDYLIVSDCRFKNEFDSFPEALRIRLVSSLETRKERSTEGWKEENEHHQSETDLDLYCTENKFDLVLSTNTLSVSECVERVRQKLETNWIGERK